MTFEGPFQSKVFYVSIILSSYIYLFGSKTEGKKTLQKINKMTQRAVMLPISIEKRKKMS